jgi:hypothetical protein
VAWLSAVWLTSPVAPALALAQTPAQVTIAPPAGALVAGRPVTLDVIAQGVHNLYGAELHLRFDPAVMQVEDADLQQAGLQLVPGSLFDPTQATVVVNQADNQAGTAVFAVTLLNPAPAVEGGLLAQLKVVPSSPACPARLESVADQPRYANPGCFVARAASPGRWSAILPENYGERRAWPHTPAPPPVRSVPIWMLVLVALIVVSLPLVGAWFFFIREAER